MVTLPFLPGVSEASVLPPGTPPFNPQAPLPGPRNILQEILGGGANLQQESALPSAPDPSRAPVPPARTPRPRQSVLDIIGGVADTFATVGGVQPQFQPTLDARADRARQEEAAGIQKRLAEQQLQAGDHELRNINREAIGDTLGGIVGQENPGAAWRAVASQTGLPPEKIEAIGQALDANPELAGSLAASFGHTPARSGSLPKDLQTYKLLQQERPDLADQFLEKIARGDDISAYQLAQLALGRGRLDLQREQFENPRPSVSERRAQTDRERELQSAVRGFDIANDSITRLRQAFADLRDAGSINAPGQTGEERIAAFANEKLPFFERVFNEQGFSARQQIETIVNNMVLETLPLLTATKLGGRNFDAAKELEFHKKRIASASDYNAAIAEINALERKLNSFRTSAERELQSSPETSDRSARGARTNPTLEAAEAEARRRGLRN